MCVNEDVHKWEHGGDLLSVYGKWRMGWVV